MTTNDIFKIRLRVLEEDKILHTVQTNVSWNVTLTVSRNIHDVNNIVFIDLYRETE